MAKKKNISKLKTGAFTRSFSLAKLGLQAGAKAAGHAVGNLMASEAGQALRKKAHLLEQAALFTRELGQLKGSLMKAGQMLSVYGEHFLPPEANMLLKSLQSDSPPVDWKEMQKVLTRQLGKDRLAALDIQPEALAAASLGQVHRAMIRSNGEAIVLKIQYPGVDRAIDGDLQALRKFLAVTEFLPKLPATDDLFAEVKSMLRQELDYEQELEMLRFFRGELKGDSRYVLPRPHPEFSSKRVLAMDYEPGIALDAPEVAALSQERRNAIGTAALELYFRELFDWHRVQTDAHFGNFRLRLRGVGSAGQGPGKDPDQLVLYDFGAVRTLSPAFVGTYRVLLRGLFHEDQALFEKGAYALGILAPTDPPELKETFFTLCAAITEPFGKDQPFDWKESDLPTRVSKLSWEILKKFPLRAPPRELVFLDRKMAGMFTLLASLRVRIDARAILAKHLKD